MNDNRPDDIELETCGAGAEPTTENVRLILARMAEHVVLAHRYLYYVLGDPVVPDSKYDVMEANARKILTDVGLTESPVFKVGSDCAEHYDDTVKALAMIIKNQAR